MIIFLYGDDSFRSNQKFLEIKKKFLSADKAGSGLSVFDFGEKNPKRKFLDVFGMANLLSSKRLIIAKNLISFGADFEQEETFDFLKNNSDNLEKDSDTVAVFWEENQPKKSNKLFKFLDGNSKKQNFEKLPGIRLGQWILKRIKEIDPGAGISKSALEKLILYAGADSRLLDKEIQKLTNFSGGKMIKEEDIDLLVRANLDVSIFKTIDAIASGDKKEAAKFLHQHLAKGEDPFYIFSMFVYQFRNLLKISDLKDRFGGNEMEISRASKMHPYVVKKSLNQIRNFSREKLKNTYRELGDLDMKIKTGKMEIKLALDKFIAEL